MPKKLSDREVYERLHAALAALGQEPGDNVFGDSALTTARQSLTMLQVAMVGRIDAEEEDQASSSTS